MFLIRQTTIMWIGTPPHRAKLPGVGLGGAFMGAVGTLKCLNPPVTGNQSPGTSQPGTGQPVTSQPTVNQLTVSQSLVNQSPGKISR